MNKIVLLIFTIFLLNSCSLHDSGGFWSKQESLATNQIDLKPLFEREELLKDEFNSNYLIKINASNLETNESAFLDNNDSFVKLEPKLENISKYQFSKIDEFNKIEPNLIFHENGIIFFDDNGTIINFDNQSNLLWKKNVYTKNEKKNQPILTFIKINNQLIVADNFSKLYSLNIDNGDILWKTENSSPFNSQIKFYKDKFFIIDADNILGCYSVNDGSLLWQYKTEKPFISSLKKLSLVIKDDQIIFNNSIGDITAVNLFEGSLLWQISTLKSNDYNDIMNLKTSNLIIDDTSIYFSNNKNMFFSIDQMTGGIIWKQKINSIIKPAIIDDLLFSISLNGLLFVVDKKSGNILRITNVFDQFNFKTKNKVEPTGIILNTKKFYVTTNKGHLMIGEIETGKTSQIIKLDKAKISRPFVNDQSIYFIKKNSILKLN